MAFVPPLLELGQKPPDGRVSRMAKLWPLLLDENLLKRY